MIEKVRCRVVANENQFFGNFEISEFSKFTLKLYSTESTACVCVCVCFLPIHSGIKFVGRKHRISRYSVLPLALYIYGVHGVCVCVCVFSSHSFWTSSSLDVPAGVTQDFSSTFLLRCVP